MAERFEDPKRREGENRVLVFREILLSGSETFIRNQTDAMTRWKPILAGLDRVESHLSRPDDMVLTPGISDIRRRLFKITRRSHSIRREIQRLEPRLIHVHFGMDATMLLPTVSALGLPLVVTFHGVDVNVLPHSRSTLARLYRARMPELFERSSKLVAPSAFVRDRLIRLGAREEKVEVLPIGVPLAPAASPATRKGVTFVGRLTEVKGCADAILAYARLPRLLRSAHPLRIVGDGDQREALEALALKLGVEVEMLGMRSSDEVRDILADSVAFIAPSKRAKDGATEAFGMVYLEAALASLPVVAYASGGVEEAVVDGQTGLLAREGDVVQLGVHLEALLSDATLRRRLGEAGRERVAKQFDITVRTRALEQLYDEVVIKHESVRSARKEPRCR